jgi:hypothetical protein
MERVPPRLMAIRDTVSTRFTARCPVLLTEHDRAMVDGGGRQTRPRVFGKVLVAEHATGR